MSALRHVLTVLVMSVLLAGCQEDGSETSDGEVPELLNPLRVECEKSGGRWGSVPGRDSYTCYHQTRDAHKPCSTERDCEGVCLARSRTCAPQTPLFGCHEVISSSGLRQTMCRE